MPSCTGCTIVINGVALPGTGLGSSTPFLTRQIIGEGFGAFSGITNFNLGTLEFYTTSNTNGQCTGYTGLLQSTGSNQSGTGLFSWASNSFICTGSTSCVTQIYQRFIPHPMLSGIAPTFRASLVTWNSEGNFDAGQSVGGTTHTTPTYRYDTSCGFQDYIFNSMYFMLAPYSGAIRSEITTNINCLACVSGA
jgi:hypothetical protein